MMKKKYEFSVRMQQRHLKAIVAGGSACVAFGGGIGSASAAFRTGGALGGKRCQKDADARAIFRANFELIGGERW